MIHYVDYKQWVLCCSCIIYAFEQYLSYRQYRQYLIFHRPKGLGGIVSKQDFKRSQAYNVDKSRLGFVREFCKQVQLILMLYLDCLPKLWSLAGDLVQGEAPQSLAFIVIYSLSSTLANLPWSLYSAFVIEEMHGFNNQTFGLFLGDLVKSELVATLTSFPLIFIFLWIIKTTGDSFYLYLWLAVAIFQILQVTLYPILIRPLFNKMILLKHGELRSEIERMTSDIHFPLQRLYVIDSSRRTGHANAYFYGLGYKQIVLYDTLIQQTNTREICAILAHELGHWHLSHTLRLFCIQQVYQLLLFLFFSSLSGLCDSFGFPSESPVINFLLFDLVWSPIERVVQCLIYKIQRDHEYQADRYALSLGYTELPSALKKVAAYNRGEYLVDPWFNFWYHSHPCLLDRLNTLK
ncbi:hypothetical protein G6F56_002923 [Rhizopus delemar]|nr:hypothetical protein G6F56_002923 [Rhizopus delemar]